MADSSSQIEDGRRDAPMAAEGDVPSASAGRTWRLLVQREPARGAWNMAVDEAISRAVAEGEAPATLRFYAWAPPCVSLGRHQSLTALDTARCRALGYEIVRRPTGGRAILHTDEFTYSVIAPADEPAVQGLVLDSYLRLSRGLVAGLAKLGIAAEPAPGTNRAGPNASAACFEVPSAYELVAGGKKLLGSAQNRRAKVVLQHGSLPLFGDLTRLVECLALPDDHARATLRRNLADHATTVEQILGRRVPFDEVAAAMAAGFQEALGMALAPGELSPAELALAERLLREQYDHPDWTERT
jgi:lipoate-protein ligase A